MPTTDDQQPPGRSGDPERRRQPRLSDRPPLDVSGVPATVHDISRHGICLIVDAPLAEGERHRLRLTDALDESSRTMDAEVVWNSGNRAGLRWVDPTPGDDQWLLERFQTWLRSLEGASRR
ncbi:MAG TPA: PilZ domain-containing protein [Armatimonadota bacterium]|nr:PilZ domain-containing protein [Armatimonadota bacterium]